MRDFIRQQQEAAEHNAWFDRQVRVGLDSANAGDVLPSDEVESEAATWRGEMQRKLNAAI